MRRYRYGKVTLAAATLAILMAGVVSATGPAGAAFPGANGKIVFKSDRSMGEGVVNPEGDDEIFTMNPDGSGVEQLTQNADEDTAPEYSADGEQIVFVREGQIYKMNADDNADDNVEVPLTPESNNNYNPVWSPNGEQIAFERYQGGDVEIYKMRAAAGFNPRNLTQSPRNRDYDPAWSPGGEKIAFARVDREGDADIYKMSTDGFRQVRVTKTDADDFSPDFSPDGQRIAFERSAPNGNEPDIYKMMADGTKQTRLTAPDLEEETNPAWSPDGKKISYVRYDQVDDYAEIQKMDADGSDEINLTRKFGSFNSDPDWQPIP